LRGRQAEACTQNYLSFDFQTLDIGRYTFFMPKKAKSNIVKVGLIQMNCDQNPAANLKKAITRIGEAAKKGAQIVCLQELFRSQYFCQTEDIELFKLAETIPGPTTDALSKVAKAKKVVIVASLFEKRAAGVYHNTAVMIDADGKIAGKYRKMHIPDDPLTTKNFISRRVTWVFKLTIPDTEKSARSSAGTSGFRKQRG
jgi:predicted amidohydrolase